jgi:hypothetical protein
MRGGTRVTRNIEVVVRARLTVPASPRSLTKPCSMVVNAPTSSSEPTDSRHTERS